MAWPSISMLDTTPYPCLCPRCARQYARNTLVMCFRPQTYLTPGAQWQRGSAGGGVSTTAGAPSIAWTLPSGNHGVLGAPSSFVRVFSGVVGQCGGPGSNSDCGIYNWTDLEPALREGTMGFQDVEPLPHDDRDVPYFLVGDDAFPLRP